MKTSELDRVKATQRAIKKAMIDKDIRRREDLAAAIDMPLSTFNFKLRTGRLQFQKWHQYSGRWI